MRLARATEIPRHDSPITLQDFISTPAGRGTLPSHCCQLVIKIHSKGALHYRGEGIVSGRFACSLPVVQGIHSPSRVEAEVELLLRGHNIIDFLVSIVLPEVASITMEDERCLCDVIGIHAPRAADLVVHKFPAPFLAVGCLTKDA